MRCWTRSSPGSRVPLGRALYERRMMLSRHSHTRRLPEHCQLRWRLSTAASVMCGGAGAWITSLLIVLLTRPPRGSLAPVAGLDLSWQAGLAMAFERGLEHGSDIVFTYGPLGFIGAPPRLWTVHTALLAILFSTAAATLLTRALLRHSIEFLPWWAAISTSAVLSSTFATWGARKRWLSRCCSAPFGLLAPRHLCRCFGFRWG
jgi:hypothetical protein